MLRSSLCDYGNAYVFPKGTITVENNAVQAAAANNTNKKVIFNHYDPFLNFMRRINNGQVDDAHDTDVVMPMYNLIKFSDNYLKISRIL